MSTYDERPTDRLFDEELGRDLAEFEKAKIELDKARMRYEIAKERFIATKNLATELKVSTSLEYLQDQHAALLYFGTPIGVAILQVLHRNVADQVDLWDGEMSEHYGPELTLDQIVRELEKGGFEFESRTPGREVNAALINLKGTVKRGEGRAIEDHERLFATLSENRKAKIEEEVPPS